MAFVILLHAWSAASTQASSLNTLGGGRSGDTLLTAARMLHGADGNIGERPTHPRASDRRIVVGKVTAIARKGPGGLVRLARNAGRIAAGRWEHPAPPERWRQLLEARRFADVRVDMVENEAGIAVARRPQESRS